MRRDSYLYFVVGLTVVGFCFAFEPSRFATAQEAKGDVDPAPKPATPEKPEKPEKPEPTPPAPTGGLADKFREVLKKLDALRQEVEDLRRAAEPPPKPDLTKKPLRAPPPGEWTSTMRWRAIGPAGMGGRISDLAVFPGDPSLYWVATASGGLLKTTNNGVTFEHQFDREATVSIGAVAVAPSNPQVVWIGTGEANPRNSVSYGDGVYKSTDGGRSWKNMGLKKSFQIGRICVHPTNSEIVYVGALGRLYGPHEERGVFKTSDGGATWERVLYVDDRTGVVDLAMHPREPDTLLAALWDRQRDEFDSHRGDPPLAEGLDQYDPARKWGLGSGLYKTTDGGRNWKRINANPQSGLPSCMLGRMDVDYYAKDPNVVFAIVDCEKIGMGTPLVQSYAGLSGQDHAEGGARLAAVNAEGPAAAAGLKAGDIVKALQIVPAAEGLPAERFTIASYVDFVGQLRRRPAGEKLVVEFVRDGQMQTTTLTLGRPPLSVVATSSGASFLGVVGETAESGARITQVTAGGPADKAGLKTGDLIVSLDKLPLPSYGYFGELLRKRRIGERIALVVRRGDQTLELMATMGERAAEPAAGSGPAGLTPALLGASGEGSKQGFKITAIADNRAARKAGLEIGDVIKTADDKPVADSRKLGDLLGQHVAGDQVKLQIERQIDGKQESREVLLTLELPFENPLRPYTAIYAGQDANIQDFQGPNAHEYGGVYKSIDGGETWKRVNSLNPRPMYFSQVRVDPSDDRYVYVLGVSLHRSPDGGQTFTSDGGRRVHADQHALWIDPRDGRHSIVGTDGGFYATYDRMEHWDHMNHLAIAQFYHVAIDNQQPYWVYGGLQDNGSWGGPSRALSDSGLLNEDWRSVSGGDGFVCRVDPFDPDIVYSEMQNGAMNRLHVRTGQRVGIRPPTQPGQRYRFNWNTPFILSNHNPGILYCAGNYVYRSVKRGEELKVISPEITRTGRGSATAIGESPRDPDVLWVGTDDGQLSVTQNGGREWRNVVEKVGLPGPRWIATIEPSRHATGRCYVTFDGHRSNDDEPSVYITEDFGDSWKPLRGNLPWGSTRCLREDFQNPDLLFVGTEFAVWASIDRGQQWFRINENLPTVAIHELALHPTAGELVAATHGRSLWVSDVSLLRQLTGEALKAPAWLFQPTKVTRWRTELGRATGGGSRRFVADAPPREALIRFSLNVPTDKPTLKILDINGATIRELPVRPQPGLQTVAWDLVGASRRPAVPRAGRGGGPGGGGGGGGGGGPGGGRGGRTVEAGEYRVVLTVDGQEFTQTVRIENDPRLPSTGSTETEDGE